MIDQKYEPLRELGAGMSGEVFLVQDTHGIKMALKLLKTWQQGMSREAALENFKEEFRVLKNLRHPNIARILDFGKDEESDRYYFTSEFIDGHDFFNATVESSPQEIEALIVQALRALEYLHAQGITHLDIKVSNLLINNEGQVKLIDFGLAGERLRSKMVGTPSYMAPEIIYGETPNGRADLYSLGALFYYTLARENPFKGHSIQETLDRQKKLSPPPISKANPDVPEYLNRVLGRLLEKNRSERYSQAALVIRDINLLGANDYPVETSDTLQSYLPNEGALVGRDKELLLAQKTCLYLRQTEGKPIRHTLWVRGRRGTGKTRFLNELKYFCQLNDLKVLHFSPEENIPPFSDATIVLIDDVDHWSERDQERWLDYLQAGDSVSLITVMTSVPEAENPLPLAQALMAQSGLETITLNNLSKEELSQYVVSLTGLEEPPSQLVDALYVRTDGNPLFVSELLKTLIANQLLFDSQGRWRRATLDDIGVDFSRLALPETLRELVGKAYLELPRPLQEILILLALFRQRPTLTTLRALLKSETFEEDISQAIQQGLIEKDPLSQGLTLKNPLWIEVITEKLDPNDAALWHDRIADWLEAEGGDLNKQNEMAYHRGHGSDPDRAYAALFPLAQELVQQGRGIEAIPFFEKILSRLTDSEPRRLISLYMGSGEATLQAGQYRDSLETYQKIRPLLPGIENRDENIFYKVDIREKLSGVALKLGKSEEAKADAQAGLALLTDYKDDPIRRMILENALGQVWCQEGQLDRAETQFLKTQEAWEALSSEQQNRITNNDLGFVYLLKGEIERAIEKLQDQLRFTQRLPKRYPETRCHYNLAEAFFANQDNKSTIHHYQQCITLAKELKSYDLLLRAYNGLGNVYSQTQEVSEGIDYYTRALTIAQKLDDHSSQAAIHCNLGILYQERSEMKDAEHHLLGAIRILQSLKETSAYDMNYLARSHLELGSLLRQQKSFESARDHLRDAETLISQHPPLKNLHFWVLYELAHLYQEQNRTDEYRSTVTQLRKKASTPEEMKKLEELEVPPSTKKVSAAPSSDSTRSERFPEEAEATPAWKGLLKILRFLNSERDLAFLLKTILRYALELSHFETALVLLLSKEDQLEIRAALQTTVDSDLTTFSTQVAQEVLETGKLILSDNAQEDSRFEEARSVHLLKLRQVLALPIGTPNKIIGVLYLDTRIQSDVLYGPETLELLQAFADQAGLAIENARLLVKAHETHQEISNQLHQVQDELSLSRALLREDSLQFQTRYSYKNIVTRSRAMQELFIVLDKITDTSLAVLIKGETGTGKELIARALHYNSTRRDREFVAVNCGAIPAELIESELFGHKAGAFTGATRDKVGLCELADGGTLLLDEVGELTAPLQVKMLRFLQEKEFRRVGDTQTRRVDVRVIAATHQDLEKKIQEGTFREDLYFRLCEIPLQIPPLRERREDIPLLVKRFTEDYQEENKIRKKYKIEKRLLAKIINYDWPGNIRELENFIRVACALAEKNVLSLDSLPRHSPLAPPPPGSADADVEPTRTVLIDGKNRYRPDWKWSDYEKIFTAHAYRHHRFRALPTSQSVGLTPPTIYRKIREWDLEDSNNSLYNEPFQYRDDTDLKEFRNKLFQAALTYHQRPYTTLRSLGVSQGFFYKVIREA